LSRGRLVYALEKDGGYKPEVDQPVELAEKIAADAAFGGQQLSQAYDGKTGTTASAQYRRVESMSGLSLSEKIPDYITTPGGLCPFPPGAARFF
jgi:hypothetical protein